MAITISGENNNDRILASDGVIDQISGINIVGLITASHINVGSNINLGNAGIITATTFVGNVTGNVNSTSPLLLQTGGSERFRITGNNELGIAGANYGTSGQVLTSGGSGSAVSWTTITTTTINNNADNRVITGTGSANVLNAESNVHVDGSGRLLVGTSTNNAHANADNAVISGTGNIGLSIMSTDSGRSSIYFGDSSSSPGSYAGFIDFVHSSNSFNVGRGNDNSLTIDSSGRVLIGTTIQGTAGADELTLSTGGSTGITIRSGSSNDGNLYFAMGTTGNETYRGFIQYEHSNNALRFGTNATERLRIASTGQVLIGTTTPSGYSNRLLTVAAADGDSSIELRTATDHAGQISFSDGSAGDATNYRGYIQYNHDGDYMRFGTSSTERIRIDSIGRLLVNRTSTYASSSERLSVNGMTSIQGSSTSTAPLYVFNTETTADGTVQPFFFLHDGSGIRGGLGLQRSTSNFIINGQNVIQFRTGSSGVGGTERLRIDSSGNVGINRTSPAALLHVSKSYTAPTGGIDGNTCLLLSNSGGSAYAGLAIQGTTSGGSYIHFGDTDDINVGNILYDHPTNSMQLITNATERLRITSNGSLNIGGTYTGTTHKLQVDNGTSHFKGRVFIRGTMSFNSTPFGANVTYDTGISVNAGGYGGSILAICSKNYGAGTNTQSGVYLIKFHYDGNNTPSITLIAGSNLATFAQSGSNTLTVAMGASNNMFTAIESSVVSTT